MRILILTVGFLSLFVNALQAQHQFNWLKGTWKIKGKFVYEVWWSGSEENELVGKSYRVKEADTVVTEKIKLVHKDGAFHYMPEVPENNGPVDFKITYYDDHSFIAENPQHDFPKIIRYTIIRKEAGEILEASIEGNGKVISYTFEKIR